MPRQDAENPFDNLQTEGLLDTGATGTGLRREVIDRLGLPPQGQRRIETANGMMWAKEYLVRVGFSLDSGAAPAPNHALPFIFDQHFIGFELPAGFTYPVLIGMDVIRRCDLHVLRDGTARLDLS